MIVARRDILAHVRRFPTTDAEDVRAHETDAVLRALLGDQELRSVDALVEFCSNPDNLASHLADPDLRLATAADLSERLVRFRQSGYGLAPEVFFG